MPLLLFKHDCSTSTSLSKYLKITQLYILYLFVYTKCNKKQQSAVYNISIQFMKTCKITTFIYLIELGLHISLNICCCVYMRFDILVPLLFFLHKTVSPSKYLKIAVIYILLLLSLYVYRKRNKKQIKRYLHVYSISIPFIKTCNIIIFIYLIELGLHASLNFFCRGDGGLHQL